MWMFVANIDADSERWWDGGWDFVFYAVLQRILYQIKGLAKNFDVILFPQKHCLWPTHWIKNNVWILEVWFGDSYFSFAK